MEDIRNEEIRQYIKITPLEKLSASECVRIRGEKRHEFDKRLSKFLANKNILVKDKKLVPGKRWDLLIWQGSEEKTLNKLTSALADFSVKENISFLINYSIKSSRSDIADGTTITTFYPEIIMNGKLLIHDFNNPELNRRFLKIDQHMVIDITNKEFPYKYEEKDLLWYFYMEHIIKNKVCSFIKTRDIGFSNEVCAAIIDSF
ncbi:MAG: hypothetical protein J5710_05680 [Treponema sp.]|nr:hypothetical protein [Treponema sp.]